MNIRSATSADKPAIITLLKQSLGESTIPKSEALWSWKHEQNPFGESYVLVAEEAGELIGLRAFMQWQWQWNNTVYKAIRAVDTATHPAHQGKGIFKKLTLQQAEACKQQGVSFVFNTPNEQSKPGYIKMGWIEQGKMPLKIKLRLSDAWLPFTKNKTKKIIAPQNWNEAPLDRVSNSITDCITTVLTPEYIKWRYANNPLFNYNYFTDGEQFIVITRLKSHAFADELRITDFILLNNKANVQYINKTVAALLRRFCSKHHIGFITLSGRQYLQYQPYFKWMGIVPVKAAGPIITLKNLNLNGSFDSFLNTANWSYSLGDMELF
ncbi:GNAT family N-acetyltransferase [Ilyomonas limi]|uniref:GNAT family N-acetyltransferase n=1 Tax=Ilyomonas limi TaxID=2575867 RepID=A0A4V5UVJ1_9BACT|nr:GNAT family N-acetyltransferase [Ilyomonas limi]TKK65023.1 GNAT family N-acetyltransferase [Ilyomonas limi]